MKEPLISIILEPIKESDLEKFCKSILTIKGIAADYKKDISERNNIITIEVFYKKEDLKYIVDYFGKKEVFSQEYLEKYPKTLDL